jgi:hypothetical protein
VFQTFFHLLIKKYRDHTAEIGMEYSLFKYPQTAPQHPAATVCCSGNSPRQSYGEVLLQGDKTMRVSGMQPGP